MRFSNLVQQIKEVSRPEWFAASALSVAMFSVGFSVSVAACSAKKVEPRGKALAGGEARGSRDASRSRRRSDEQRDHGCGRAEGERCRAEPTPPRARGEPASR